MAFNLTEIASATMVLFAVIDIIGSIPIILDIKKRAGEVHPEKAVSYTHLTLPTILLV